MNGRKACCSCKAPSQVLQEEVARLLNAHGDVPPDSVRADEIDLKDWHLICDPDDRAHVVAAGKVEKSKADWYSCTAKNVVTDPEYRGRGLGGAVGLALEAMAQERGCLILTADITEGNIGSERIFEKLLGMRATTRFCMGWEEPPKHASVYQKVLAEDTKCKRAHR